MKRLLVFSVLLATAAFAADSFTVDRLMMNRDDLNEREVTVKGVVSEFKARESKAGNKYTTLKLKGENSVISGYSRGHLKDAPKDGDTVELTGIYRKEKKVSASFTVENEVDFTKVEKRKFGFKIVKRKGK